MRALVHRLQQQAVRLDRDRSSFLALWSTSLVEEPRQVSTEASASGSAAHVQRREIGESFLDSSRFARALCVSACPQAARANPDQSAAFWTDPTDPLRVFSAQPLPVADTVPRLAVLSQVRAFQGWRMIRI